MIAEQHALKERIDAQKEKQRINKLFLDRKAA
jgi:hypothetical protein